MIAVIAILASLLLPALSGAKEAGRTAKCLSNVHQMSLALALYVHDQEAYPPLMYHASAASGPNSWYDKLVPYLGTWTNGNSVFRCPSFKYKQSDRLGGVGQEIGVGSYGYNSDHPFGLSMGDIGYPPYGPNIFLRDSKVVMPSQMLAIGDAQLIHYEPDKIIIGMLELQYEPIKWRKGWIGFPNEMKATYQRHKGRHMIGFCDGHVEKLKYTTLFADDMESRRIWNYDHEPHLTPYD